MIGSAVVMALGGKTNDIPDDEVASMIDEAGQMFTHGHGPLQVSRRLLQRRRLRENQGMAATEGGSNAWSSACPPLSRRWLDHHAPNCISNWFPRLQEVGARVPRTAIVRLSEDEADDLTLWAYGEPPPSLKQSVDAVRAACDTIGYPCFLRSGQTSAKHGWKDSCYIPHAESVESHMYQIVEYSAMAGFDGLPLNVWAARELLPTVPAFTAFYGRMPITREFRFFVRDGKVEHWQPHWPGKAIEGQSPDSEDWELWLAEISDLDDVSLAGLTILSEEIGLHIGGYWSIDWLWVQREGEMGGEWHCTDMAVGEQSYKWMPETGEEVDA
jgi:hypothetical protein